ncbi:BZ3500_MvSof-1268-A1-R1_Chr1-2g01401 [Microbotryum saponariae]|uniref:BZ3500_MvSof-1268-A1-R1_Chr1-2g01401 protein n=1 Tax=Microbotryum saponariae TaxID=289078 RepID=A0A2X0KK65_9BASI|nr:BZ3500_MvSof-1268-A1-R1_Chr1-2g01401 [Microbotryum saponariae]SCZ97324.1 BZ3501_MvSof-1269-A2-R1_Chr1-2g01000 [Microbotryum saponariae]
MSYGGALDSYGLAEDVAVYSFDSLGDDHDLGGLLDEGMNDLNDETFGLGGGETNDNDTFGSVGRDFDFAGNTSRMLANDKPLQKLDNSWMSGPAQASKPFAAAPPSSAWNSLDADPLLSGASSYRPPAPMSYQQVASATQPRSNMRTLDEIEAEMRNQARSAAPPAPAPAPPSSKPLTLEELEAEMLPKARAGASAAPQVQQPSAAPQSEFPPLGAAPTQAPPAEPPAQQQQGQQQPFFGAGGAPTFPPLGQQPGFAHAGPPGSFPPQQFGRPMPPFGPGMPMPPPHMLGPGQSPSLPAQMLPPRGADTPFQGPPGAPPMMNTLFPPLPSQAGGLALVEQQLQFLTMNQHAQHPSLTSAQLQSLLQQAHSQANTETAAAPVGEKGDTVEGDEELKKKAGEDLIKVVEQRILEHEMLEQKRKRKAMKIAAMVSINDLGGCSAKHNNLMSNSDKDFITRIQVSQLVTDDPYADDFYFHIMAAIKMSRHQAALAAGAAPGTVPFPPLGMGPGGPGGRNGPGGNANNNRRPTRRENAMNRMAQNVQRLVDSAKQRNKSGQLSLDGALGKIALRTRSAPRQMLQVKPDAAGANGSSKKGSAEDKDSKPSTGSHLLEGLVTQSSVAANATSADDGKPLSHRSVLAILEKVYDAVLDLEQLRRIQPQLLGAAAAAKDHHASAVAANASEEVQANLEQHVVESQKAVDEWTEKYDQLANKLWTELRVMEPLDRCTPHPFIALISVLKGKRILPRALRHLSPEQTLTSLTLMVATFDTLDTVQDAPILDSLDETSGAGSIEGKQRRAVVETKTEAFLNAFLAPVMAVIGQAPLRMVTGMLGLLMERNDFSKVVQSKPGLAFLTIFLSRAESIKQATPAPDAQDLQGWQRTFDHLFNSLVQQLPRLFPSTRAISTLPFGAAAYLSNTAQASGPGHLNTIRPEIDFDDEPVWRLLAAVAVCAEANEQETLVSSVRDKVLENVMSAKKARIAPEVAALKIRNVNLLLHSLGLDASMLNAE